MGKTWVSGRTIEAGRKRGTNYFGFYVYLCAQIAKVMKKLTILLVLMGLLTVAMPAGAQQTNIKDSTEVVSADSAAVVADSAAVVADSAMAAVEAELTGADPEVAEEGGGLHKQLKRKFLEGSAGFMSLVALALVLWSI